MAFALFSGDSPSKLPITHIGVVNHMESICGKNFLEVDPHFDLNNFQINNQNINNVY